MVEANANNIVVDQATLDLVAPLAEQLKGAGGPNEEQKSKMVARAEKMNADPDFAK